MKLLKQNYEFWQLYILTFYFTYFDHFWYVVTIQKISKHNSNVRGQTILKTDFLFSSIVHVFI